MQNSQRHKSLKVGVGLAGLGFGQKVHLPALYNSKMLSPIAIWHPRKQRLDEACKENEILGHEEWSALLNNPKVDAVIISTPPEHRFNLAIQALEAGKHLFLEKPVALNSNQIKDISNLMECILYVYKKFNIN